MNFIKLQINGENLNLDLLTERIGITPTFICRKGDTNNVIGNIDVTAVNDTWVYAFETEELSEKSIKEFVEKFSMCSGLFEELRIQGVIPYLVITPYIKNYQTFFSIPHKLVLLIAQLNLELCFDIMYVEDLCS